MSVIISIIILIAALSIWDNIISREKTNIPSKEPYDFKIMVSTDDPLAGREVLFNVTSIPPGSDPIWNISGYDVTFSGEVFVYNFSLPGEYNISCQVHFEGEMISNFLLINVRNLSRPVAMMELYPDKNEFVTGEEILLSGSQSYDEDGDIISYAWYVGEEMIKGRELTYIFTDPGEYWIGLKVIDDEGQESSVWNMVHVHSLEDLIKNNLSLDIDMKKPSYYVDDEIYISLTLKNNGSYKLNVNPFNSSNLIFSFSTEFYNIRGGWKQFEPSSREGSLIGNRTWETMDEKVVILPGSDLTIDINLRNFSIYLGEFGEGEEWRTMDWFMKNHMDFYWINTILESDIEYIPGNDSSDVLETGQFMVPIEWRPIHEYILDRQVDNKTESMILDHFEDLDYSSISGRERWEYYWGAFTASYIDTIVIQNFTNRFNSQRNYSEFKTHIFFNYTASVHSLDNFAFSSVTLETIFNYNNGSSLPEGYHGGIVRSPDWEYKDIDLLNNTDLNETACYMVRMDLKYHLLYGPLGANYWSNYQWVVVTKDLDVLYILSEQSYGVS